MTDTDWGEMAGSEFENIRLSHKDRALFFVLTERDFEAQLYAIRGALQRNREAEASALENIQHMREQIDSLDPQDDRNRDHLGGYLTDMYHESVYTDAAHSMSAVGLLAPFIESLFVSIFSGLREQTKDKTSQDSRAKATQNQYWNPKIVFGKDGPRDDIVAGIGQLAISIGLQPFLPVGYQKALFALFGYRNNMFHSGFEWPPEARRKFANRIRNEDWPSNWFTQATRGDEPWVFYMSDEFIAHCLQMIDQVLQGVGRYLEQGETGQL